MKKTGGPCAPPRPRPGLGLATRLRAVLLASPVSPSFRPRRPSLLAAPAWLSSWPARLCPQAWGQPQHRHPTRGVEWGRETTAAWAQRPWAGSSLCPAHPAGGFQPQVTKGWGHCPTASPTLLGPLAGPFPSPPPTAATGEHCQAQAQGGDGALPTRWTLLSSIYMFLLPPHGGSQDPGAWKEAVPQEPKKVSTSIIGALEPSHQASDGAAGARPPSPVADRVGPAGGAVLSAVTWDSRGPF